MLTFTQNTFFPVEMLLKLSEKEKILDQRRKTQPTSIVDVGGFSKLNKLIGSAAGMRKVDCRDLIGILSKSSAGQRQATTTEIKNT